MTEQLGVRKRLLSLIQDFPGLHLRELARQADLSEALTGYHAKALHEAGFVDVQRDGVFRRYYPKRGRAPDKSDRRLMAGLRKPVLLRMVLIMLEEGPVTHTRLTQRLGLAKSTVSYHLGKLNAHGILLADKGGVLALADAQRVERLLVRWDPPEGLVDRFARLWQRFYESHR